MGKLRVGIIGCGGIANMKHMPSLRATCEVEMVGFCDLIVEKAEKAKKEFGAIDAKVYTDYKEMLKDESIDTIHVCTPNRSHSYITVDALNAGKHVMCEKPMAINYAEACKMVEAAKRTGKLLTIGYQNRYRGDSQYLKAECEKGTLGEIYFARAKAIRRRAVPTWGVFLNEYEQGGGPLIDIGTHALDMTLYFMNNYKPKFVVGSVYHKLNKQKDVANLWGDWDQEKFTAEDSAFGYIVMENGATIILESSWALNTLDEGEALTVLCGTKAGADMLEGLGTLRINGVENNRKYTLKPSFEGGGVPFFGGVTSSAEIIECMTFINAVKGNGKLVVLPEQAIVVTKILDGLYESAKTGKPYYFNNNESN